MNVTGVNLLGPMKDTLSMGQMTQDGSEFEQSLQKAIEEKDDKKLKEACEQIETYMLTSLFKQMKKSTDMGERLIPKGDYEEMFESYMVEEQCKNLTQAGGIGLADMMYKQMTAKVVEAPSVVDAGV